MSGRGGRGGKFRGGNPRGRGRGTGANGRRPNGFRPESSTGGAAAPTPSLQPMERWFLLDTCGIDMLSDSAIQRFIIAVSTEAQLSHNWTISSSPTVERCTMDEGANRLEMMMELCPDMEFCIITLAQFGSPLYDVIKSKATANGVATQCVVAENLLNFSPDLIKNFTRQVAMKVAEKRDVGVTLSTQNSLPNRPELSGRAGNNGKPKEKSAEKESRRVYPITFEKIKLLCDDSARPAEVLVFIASAASGYAERLNDSSVHTKATDSIRNGRVSDWEMLTVAVKTFDCSAIAFREHLYVLLDQLSQSKFLKDAVPKALVKYQMESVPPENLTIITTNLMNLCTVLVEILQTIPDQISDLYGVYSALGQTIKFFNDSRSPVITQELTEVFERLTIRWDDIQKAKQSANVARGNPSESLPPPNDFRDISIFPTTDDFVAEGPPYLRRNVIKGAYQDVNHYLDVQFRLMREDFIDPIRKGVKIFMNAIDYKKVKNSDIFIYSPARILPPHLSRNGAVVNVVQFDLSSFQRVKWETSKRLMFGSLVCLSNDNFNTVYFATVYDRKLEDLKKGFITVVFETQINAANLYGTECQQYYTMVESTSYFEAYRHVLTALQHTSLESFPMEKYLIKCESKVDPPSYVQRHRTELNCSSLWSGQRQIDLLNLGSWPSADEMGLDDSQLRAIQLALTKELALIQGPPGTGKTFIGYKIAQFLLDNEKLWKPSPVLVNENDDAIAFGRRRLLPPQRRFRYQEAPILVVCYTNHALDQFLEGLAKFLTTGIIRIGGRCKNPVVEKFLIEKVLRDGGQTMDIPSDLKRAHWEGIRIIKQSAENLEKLGADMQSTATKLIPPNLLIQFMTGKQSVALFTPNQSHLKALKNWLFRGVTEEFLNQKPFENFESTTPKPAEPNSKSVNKVADKERKDSEETEEDVEDFDVEEEEMNRRQEDFLLDEELKQLALNDMIKQQTGEDEFEEDWDDFEDPEMDKRIFELLPQLLSRPDRMCKEEAEVIDSLNSLPLVERWRLYRYWMGQMQMQIAEQTRLAQHRYTAALQRLVEIKSLQKLAVLRSARIIGMTTTGAAKQQGLLLELKPKIVIIEEAAEVLEAHIITSLTPSLEHLILIGDHHQLRPNPAVYMLAKKFNLDVSLFERLILNSFEHAQLEYQHRMRPEIAATLMPHFYDNLLNDQSVYQYDDVLGMKKNVFFIDHRELEAGEAESRTKRNQHEADWMFRLCKYLIQQGYRSDQITILCPYIGQLFLIMGKTKKDADLKEVRVTAIDNFQGEESDIILLSLVRSNKEKKNGFLKIKNRVCVAMSRAKMGFFVVGNFEHLRTDDPDKLWHNICGSLRAKEMIGAGLKVICQVHGKENLIEKPEDFRLKVPDGGCLEPCKYRLDCGHACKRKCHPEDSEHKKYRCIDVCKKLCTTSDPGHECNRPCYNCRPECGPCGKSVKRKLLCGHEKQMKCGDDVILTVCREPCQTVLPCGHKCAEFCSQPHTQFCKVKVSKVRSSCGHTVMVDCSVDPNSVNCTTEMTKIWPLCNHLSTVSCSVDVATTPCPSPCEKQLECGHMCKGNCADCRQGRLHIRCDEACERLLICGHKCGSECSRVCPPCQHVCENKCQHSGCVAANKKGKKTGRKCGEPCPQCQSPCDWVCPHQRCHRCCYEPCDRPVCNVPCDKKLKCDHNCMGVCGEKCPTICGTCEPDKVKELDVVSFCGIDESTRLITLEDCGHTFILDDMDNWMNVDNSSEGGDGQSQEFAMKNCFLCRTVIRRSHRYGNIVKRNLQTIEVIKRKIIGGGENELSEDREQFLKEMNAGFVWDEPKELYQVKHLIFEDVANPSAKDLTRERLSIARNLLSFVLALTKTVTEVKQKLLPLLADLRTYDGGVTMSNTTDFINLYWGHMVKSVRKLRRLITVSNEEDSDPFLYELVRCGVDEPALLALRLNVEFSQLLSWICRNYKRCSEKMLVEFQGEMRRYSVIVKLVYLLMYNMSRRRDLDPDDSILLVNHVGKVAFGDTPVTEDMEAFSQGVLNDLWKKFGAGLQISETEKVQIITAMGLSSGHWYACPNGHVYAITECGGAMQRSVCPECNAEIGGDSHRLTDGNRVATEMDGATAPAWPQ